MRSRLLASGMILVAAIALIAIEGADDVSPRDHAEVRRSFPDQPRSLAAPRQPGPRAREAFVGSATCASCHQAQGELYVGSHHAKALVTSSSRQADARFEGSRFKSKHGGTTAFALHA